MVLVSQQKPRTTIHHKRRSGQHHKSDKRFHDTYWPYLPLALIVTLGIVFSGFLGNAQRNVLGYATNMSATGLLEHTNSQRAVNGLGALAINGQLNQAAQAKANDMVSRDYWSHNTPEGTPPWAFFTNAGYNYQTAGENLAYGFETSDGAVIGWMNSPGHKANILNTTYREVGFGIANSPDYQGTGPETVVVAMYGSQAVLASSPAPVPTPVAAAQPTPTATPTPQTPQAAAPAPTEAAPAAPVETPAASEPENTNSTVGSTPAPVTNISRIDLLVGSSAPWSMFAVSLLATVSIAIFFLRHGLFWHRTLVKGERFIIRHKFFDIALVATAVIGFILTRSAGVIH